MSTCTRFTSYVMLKSGLDTITTKNTINDNLNNSAISINIALNDAIFIKQLIFQDVCLYGAIPSYLMNTKSLQLLLKVRIAC